jgi:hypothetical protein
MMQAVRSSVFQSSPVSAIALFKRSAGDIERIEVLQNVLS